MRLLIALIPLCLAAGDLKFGTHTLSGGAGAVAPVSGEFIGGYGTGPALTGEYELGLHRFVAATLGVENARIGYQQCSRNGCIDLRAVATWMPFGLRFIAPASGGKVELFAGTGGSRMWAKDSLLGYSPTLRVTRDLGRPTQVWLSLTGGVGYRFGRR